MSGIRVAVKDKVDLEGTKTSLCSRAYLQTYPKKLKSAPCIQQLIDLGAVIVGKTKLCSFAQWEEPTEAIEYTSPWSPRADGFQSSGGSSNGSGAAVGAYEWLDIAIGSDNEAVLSPLSTYTWLTTLATGSILRPALWNGCYSLRPSLGSLSTEGMVSCIKSDCLVKHVPLRYAHIRRYLDTPGIMGRNLLQCRRFAATWYGEDLAFVGSKVFERCCCKTDIRK